MSHWIVGEGAHFVMERIEAARCWIERRTERLRAEVRISVGQVDWRLTGQMLFQSRKWQLRIWAGATESGAKNEQVSGREEEGERASVSVDDRMR